MRGADSVQQRDVIQIKLMRFRMFLNLTWFALFLIRRSAIQPWPLNFSIFKVKDCVSLWIGLLITFRVTKGSIIDLFRYVFRLIGDLC